LFAIDAKEADAVGGEPSTYNAEIVGKSLALGYVRAAALQPGAEVTIDVVGSPGPAR